MNLAEYQAFVDRWISDVEVTMNTFRVSDVAAVCLLIGDRLLTTLDEFEEIVASAVGFDYDEATDAMMARLRGGLQDDDCTCDSCGESPVKEDEP